MPSHRADTPPLRRPRTNRRRSSSVRVSVTHLSAPQVGIASALGLATIAAPLSGAMASPAPKAVINPSVSVAVAAAPAFPSRVPAVALGVASFSVVPAGVTEAPPTALSAPRSLLVDRPTRSQERSVLPGCDGVPSSTKVSNGLLSNSQLCTLWDDHNRLRADAAVAVAKMNIAYKATFGESLCITDSYRTLAEQRTLAYTKPGLAAQPGRSEHGWGLALDLCDGVEKGSSSKRYTWLRDNAEDFGWENPDWALASGSGPFEPWHWEYVPGTQG